MENIYGVVVSTGRILGEQREVLIPFEASVELQEIGDRIVDVQDQVLISGIAGSDGSDIDGSGIRNDKLLGRTLFQIGRIVDRYRDRLVGTHDQRLRDHAGIVRIGISRYDPVVLKHRVALGKRVAITIG